MFVSGSWLQFELQDLDPETERTRRRYSVSNSCCLLPECVRLPCIMFSWQLSSDGTIEVSLFEHLLLRMHKFSLHNISHIVIYSSM